MQIELTVDKNGNIVIIRKNTTTMTLVSTELITQSSNDLENQSATQLKLQEAFKTEYGSFKFSDANSSDNQMINIDDLNVSTDDLIVNAFWQPKFDNAKMRVSVKNLALVTNALDELSKLPQFGC